MTTPLSKRFESPDASRSFPSAVIDVVDLDGVVVARVRYEPGFRWSESIGAASGTGSCDCMHVGYVLAGRLRLTMDDGSTAEVGAGDAYMVPPGHDGVVVGVEAFVALDFSQDMRRYLD